MSPKTTTEQTSPAVRKAGTFKRWGRRIAAAAKRGYFNQEDIQDSNSWTRCAVGEYAYLHDLNIVTDDVWGLDDFDELGHEFPKAIGDNNFKLAKAILRKVLSFKEENVA